MVGKRSIPKAFDRTKRAMDLDPRLNRIYYTYMSEIRHDVLERIGKEVIGYDRAISPTRWSIVPSPHGSPQVQCGRHDLPAASIRIVLS